VTTPGGNISKRATAVVERGRPDLVIA